MHADLLGLALSVGDSAASRVLGGVLTYLIHSTILIAVVWLATSHRSRLRLSEASCEALWKVALVGGLVTASIQTTAGVEPLAGSMHLFATARDQLVRRVHVLVRHDDPSLRDHLAAPAPPVVVFRSLPRAMPWSLMALALIVLASATTFVSWRVMRRRALRALGIRKDIRFSVTGNAMRELCQRAGIREHVALSVSGATGSPLALPGGEICLPERVLRDFDPIAQEVILAHELAHVVRGDAAWLDAARAIEAICFFQPLNRLARRRMQEAAEYLADDWAVARTRRPLQLARCLTRIAEWVSRDVVPSAVPAMVERGGSPLVRRVLRLTNDGRPDRAPSSRLSVLAGGVALAALASAAPRVSVGNAPFSPFVPRTFALRVAGPEASGAGARLVHSRERDVRIVATRIASDSGPIGRLIIEEWDGGTVRRTVKTFPAANEGRRLLQ